MLSIQKHKSGVLYSAILGLSLLFAQPSFAQTEADQSSAVIFVYQRIGEDSIPRSSISVEQFKAHIKELQTGGYKVLPLQKIVSALKDGDTLPSRTIGITFDGGYASTLANAVPLLDEAGLPFTVFFATDLADGAAPSHMSWPQLKSLRRNKLATLGLLPSAYAHMAGQAPAQNAAMINKAMTRYKEEFGDDAEFFSYPYGEYSAAVRKQLGDYSFTAAFGMQSGVVHDKSDFLALPRFIMTDNFGDLERFRLTANALPLPATDIIPDDMLLKQNPPMIGFTLPTDLSLSKLSCFASGLGKIDIAKPGGGRVEIRLKEPLDERRTRINCTLPDDTVIPGQPPVWRWFGMQLVVPDYGDDDDQQGDQQPDTSANPGDE